MVRSKTPLVFTMSLFDTMTISKRLRDFKVTLVGLSINWWAFTEVQKDQRTSLLGVLSIKSKFASPVSTMSLLRDKAFTYVGMSSFSRQESLCPGICRQCTARSNAFSCFGFVTRVDVDLIRRCQPGP